VALVGAELMRELKGRGVREVHHSAALKTPQTCTFRGSSFIFRKLSIPVPLAAALNLAVKSGEVTSAAI
jgi:hypothetical protein